MAKSKRIIKKKVGLILRNSQYNRLCLVFKFDNRWFYSYFGDTSVNPYLPNKKYFDEVMVKITKLEELFYDL